MELRKKYPELFLGTNDYERYMSSKLAQKADRSLTKNELENDYYGKPPSRQHGPEQRDHQNRPRKQWQKHN